MAVSNEVYAQSDDPELAQLQLAFPRIIFGERQIDKVEALIPLDYLADERVVVDESDVENWQALYADETSEDAARFPIKVAYIPDETFMPITDGFHRLHAQTRVGNTHAATVINLKADWEKVIDERLTNVAGTPLEFPRLMSWVQKAWEQTQWSSKLDVRMAIRLACSTRRGRTEDLSYEELIAIQKWGERHAAKWHIKIEDIHKHITVASLADPELVANTRLGRSHDRTEFMSVAQLGLVARFLPYRFAEQQIAAELIKGAQLSMKDARGLVEALASCETLTDAITLAESNIWRIPIKNFLKSPRSNKSTRHFAIDRSSLERIEPTNAECSVVDHYPGISLLMIDQAVQKLSRLGAEASEEEIMLSEMLGDIDEEQRTALVLRVMFHLSAFGIASVMEKADERVREILFEVMKPEVTSSNAQSIEPVLDNTAISKNTIQRHKPISRNLRPHIAEGDWGPETRRNEIIKIRNLEDVNQQSVALAKQFKLSLNELTIEVDNRVYLGNGRMIQGPLETEAMNILLAKYLGKPFKLDELPTILGVERTSPAVNAYRLASLHQYFLSLCTEGIILYDGVNHGSIALRPILIKDKRRYYREEDFPEELDEYYLNFDQPITVGVRIGGTDSLPDSEKLSKADVTSLFDCDEKTLLEWRKAGLLTSYGCGRGLHFRREEVLQFFAKIKAQPQTQSSPVV